MSYQAIRWWHLLKEEEQNILITLLFNLDLSDYVEMDKDGNIINLKEE